MAVWSSLALILRSIAKAMRLERVGPPSPFETRPSGAPQGEGEDRTPSYLIASGLTGEPTAPVIGIAGATNRNS